MKSSITVNEIINSNIPTADRWVKGALRWVKGALRWVKGALRWDVPGSLRGTKGVWELSLHPREKYIIHYMFNGKK